MNCIMIWIGLIRVQCSSQHGRNGTILRQPAVCRARIHDHPYSFPRGLCPFAALISPPFAPDGVRIRSCRHSGPDDNLNLAMTSDKVNLTTLVFLFQTLH